MRRAIPHGATPRRLREIKFRSSLVAPRVRRLPSGAPGSAGHCLGLRPSLRPAAPGATRGRLVEATSAALHGNAVGGGRLNHPPAPACGRRRSRDGPSISALASTDACRPSRTGRSARGWPLVQCLNRCFCDTACHPSPSASRPGLRPQNSDGSSFGAKRTHTATIKLGQLAYGDFYDRLASRSCTTFQPSRRVLSTAGFPFSGACGGASSFGARPNVASSFTGLGEFDHLLLHLFRSAAAGSGWTRALGAIQIPARG